MRNFRKFSKEREIFENLLKKREIFETVQKIFRKMFLSKRKFWKFTNEKFENCSFKKERATHFESFL